MWREAGWYLQENSSFICITFSRGIYSDEFFCYCCVFACKWEERHWPMLRPNHVLRFHQWSNQPVWHSLFYFLGEKTQIPYRCSVIFQVSCRVCTGFRFVCFCLIKKISLFKIANCYCIYVNLSTLYSLHFFCEEGGSELFRNNAGVWKESVPLLFVLRRSYMDWPGRQPRPPRLESG
jgi:hypothetical protein